MVTLNILSEIKLPLVKHEFTKSNTSYNMIRITNNTPNIHTLFIWIYYIYYARKKVSRPPIIITGNTVGRVGVYFLSENVTINGNRYIGVLEDLLLDMMTIHGGTIFIQDWASCHTSKKVSPDLNLIENVGTL